MIDSQYLPESWVQFAWDSTTLGDFKTCPRLYYFKYICGYSSREESIHLRYGIEVHTTLEDFDRYKAKGAKHNEAVEQTIVDMLGRTYGWEVDEDTKVGRYKNRRTLTQICIDYMDNWRDDPAKTVILENGEPAVELSFRFELNDHPLNSTQPFILCGHLDRVVEWGDELYVMDRKTTYSTIGANYFNQWTPNNQMTLYTLAGQLVLNAPIRSVIIDAMQIKLEEPNAFQRGFAYRTEGMLEEWLWDLTQTLHEAETCARRSHWPQNDTSCDKFGGCRFREICGKDPSAREKFLASKFVQLPEEDRWNPLKPR